MATNKELRITTGCHSMSNFLSQLKVRSVPPKSSHKTVFYRTHKGSHHISIQEPTNPPYPSNFLVKPFLKALDNSQKLCKAHTYVLSLARKYLKTNSILLPRHLKGLIPIIYSIIPYITPAFIHPLLPPHHILLPPHSRFTIKQ